MLKISKELFDHENKLNSLKNNFLDQNISNSLIFYGNKGIGKCTFSYCLINQIYKELDNNNYNHHKNLIYNSTHPNIKIINKNIDPKTKKIKNYITIDQIREIELLLHKSTIDNLPKFIIIDSADDLNINSSNAILKILEEPTNNSYLILISHQFSQILPTIRSRCVKIKFSNVNFDNFNKILNNQIDYSDDENIKFLFDLSGGSPGIAINIYNHNIKDLFETLLMLFKEKRKLSSDLNEVSIKVSKYNNEEFSIYLSIIKFILINTIKINLGINLTNLLNKKIYHSLNEISMYLDNKISIKVLNYINLYEKNLYIFNLDKKIFNLNLFSNLSHN